MRHRYSKSNKTEMDKTIEFHKIIDSVIIQEKDYRNIFDDSIEFAYGNPLNEYSEKSINTIMVNSIRHNCSNYDSNLKAVNKINRTKYDYVQYKNSVLTKISILYPFLKNECDKQKRRLDMVNIV